MNKETRQGIRDAAVRSARRMLDTRPSWRHHVSAQTSIIDTLADLRHFADTQDDVDFADAYRIAMDHYTEEKYNGED